MSLLSLPTELVDAVVSFVSDTPTLLALTLTCRALRRTADACLFRSITFKGLPGIAKYTAALEHSEERRRAVEYVHFVPYITREDPDRMLELLGSVKVRGLRIECPLIKWMNGDVIADWWEKWVGELVARMEVVGTAVQGSAFDRLTSFTTLSHGYGRMYYDYACIYPIFLSPTLRYIHVSCADIFDVPPLPSSSRGKTPLQTLILERCRAQPSALVHLLSIPQSLTHFVLLMESASFPGSEYATSFPDAEYTTAILTALSQQANSLQYLRYKSPISLPSSFFKHDLSFLLENLSTLSTALSQIQSTGLRSFPKLHTLDIDYRSDLLATLLSPALAPPSLQDLGIAGIDYEFDTTWSHLQSFFTPIIASTPFSTLRMYMKPSREDYDAIGKIFTSPVFGTTPHREILEGVVQMVEQREAERQEGEKNAGVEVVAAGEWAGNWNAPYLVLQEEKYPGVKVVFDSRRGGKRRDGSGDDVMGEGEEEDYEVEGVDERFVHREWVPGEVGLEFDSYWSIGTKRL